MGEAESGDCGARSEWKRSGVLSRPGMRKRVDALLRSYRAVLVELARRETAAGTSFAGASPQAVATLVAAAADGLFLHARLDPELDSAGAMAALRSLLAR